MKTVLMIDCQLLQTKAWHRGMGKYTVSLLDEFLSTDAYTKKYDSIVLITNSNLPVTSEVELFMHKNKVAKKLSLDLECPSPINFSESITRAQAVNKKTLNTYLSKNYPDSSVTFLITSLFLDEACPAFPDGVHKTLIYYDLIPLMYYRLYLGLGPSEHYFTRFTVLLETNKVFAISNTVAADLAKFVGVSPKDIINIDGSINTQGMQEAGKRPKFLDDVKTKFILMPTGGDPRKNNERAIKAFDIFNRRQHESYTLVVTSIFSDEQRASLEALSSSIVFSGNVSDAELWWLYKNCEGVFFPPEYEGLGMPVIEAVTAKKLIACSDIPVFMEISDNAFFTFNPHIIEEMANSLEAMVVNGRTISKSKAAEYKRIQSKYTWINSAKLLARHLESINDSSMGLPLRTHKKIAVVMPHISAESQAARYCANMLPSLQKSGIQADWYFDSPSMQFQLIRPNHLSYACYPVQDILSLDSRMIESYDSIWCFVTNSVFSSNTIQLAMAHGVNVILCDGEIENAINGGISLGIFDQGLTAVKAWKKLALVSKVITIGRHQLPIKAELASSGVPLIRPAFEKKRSAYNRLLLQLDGGRGLDQWNIDLVRFLFSQTDEGRVEVTFFSQSKMNIHTKEQASQIRGATLYEDVSDHEVYQLLQHSDIYVDASPRQYGIDIDMMTQATLSCSTEAMFMIEGCTPGWDHGVFHALSSEQLRQELLSWLMGSSKEADNTKKYTANEPDSIIEFIKRSIDE